MLIVAGGNPWPPPLNDSCGLGSDSVELEQRDF